METGRCLDHDGVEFAAQQLLVAGQAGETPRSVDVELLAEGVDSGRRLGPGNNRSRQ
jgi:hypothetical protein